MFNRRSIHVALFLWGCIFCVIAALCMYMSRNFDKEKRRWLLLFQISSSILLLADALAWAYRGGTEMEAAVLVRVSNFLVFILSDFLLFVFHGYACCYLFPECKNRIHLVTGKKYKNETDLPKKRIVTVYWIAVIGMLMVILSQFTNLYYYIDAQNYYHRNPGYAISVILPMTGMLLELSFIIQYRKRIQKKIYVSMLSYIVLPFTAGIILIFYYGISLVNIAISISGIFMFISAMIEQNQNLAKREQEAADMRMAIMISQIQPHFMYNSLNTIYHLCDKNTELAKEAISDFSDYLQHILKSVNRSVPIPFREELRHVQAYLKLEKMRFDDDLNIIYQIDTTDFFLPPLSIQPLVENAVKHGICRREEGGTLIISTKEDGDDIEVRVSDDGVGFDPEQEKNDGKPHVGIKNVKKRLYTICHGTLIVNSKPGEGTTIIMRLPKENKE